MNLETLEPERSLYVQCTQYPVRSPSLSSEPPHCRGLTSSSSVATRQCLKASFRHCARCSVGSGPGQVRNLHQLERVSPVINLRFSSFSLGIVQASLASPLTRASVPVDGDGGNLTQRIPLLYYYTIRFFNRLYTLSLQPLAVRASRFATDAATRCKREQSNARDCYAEREQARRSQRHVAFNSRFNF